ncbi:hypothetical protein ACFP47_10280 [Nesterenkonia lacusekhoensis]|uniref:Uncharacterized protein n=1 Tax=Nesterenkonia lacusekhoensis TaxID=150832 RepID=A0ABS4T586_9MICC|nr:hypothetical protein [Nesterenkonia lacusekhoensis]MBP2319588.1 hypothetical protein [Nesterenkonia lacusekhoensis]
MELNSIITPQEQRQISVRAWSLYYLDLAATELAHNDCQVNRRSVAHYTRIALRHGVTDTEVKATIREASRKEGTP